MKPSHESNDNPNQTSTVTIKSSADDPKLNNDEVDDMERKIEEDDF